MPIIEISDEDLAKLKKLIAEFDDFNVEDENGDVEPWDFDDLTSNLEIHQDILAIISPLIEKL